MQINGASNAYYPALDRTAGNGKTAGVQAGNANADSGDGDTLGNANTDSNGSDKPASANTDSNGTDKPASAGSADPAASPVKSFVYGTLGLEHPQEQKQDTDEYYSAGKWLAAALTVGGIISIFV
ncbi:hypothetical protein FAZ95_01790 [Trinickia violacea]|uniref:Uncharacterized protein n=1 Tax=Trinickia violacea TaxID=2571746 RepID=A0A4P8IKE7_9BURK|nr:hypothetical protein [Trinickia violacea]QCP48025.1 hypothetical protein FAZ95_01790 [Trinickia violacea]